MGIRVFTGMFDFEDASGIQIVLFDMFEVLVMRASSNLQRLDM